MVYLYRSGLPFLGFDLLGLILVLIFVHSYSPLDALPGELFN
jgi:hypothetical protein